MEGYVSTDRSPLRAVVPLEEEEEREGGGGEGVTTRVLHLVLGGHE
jgi:hypothetical protein